MSAIGNSNRTIEWVLFDLGGVLVHVDPGQSLPRWTGTRQRAREFADTAMGLPEARLLETGQMTPATFADQIIAKYDLVVDRDVLLNDFRGWIRHEYPGSIQLLAKLRQTVNVACLSNTNEVHWDRVVQDLSVATYFDRAFLSHKTGFFKPDPRAYFHVIQSLKCRPEAIVFLDDRLENIEAARAAGLQAYQVQGIAAAETVLVKIGQLSR